MNGDFSSLVGLSSPYLLSRVTVLQSETTPIVRSRTYKFRYRARNCVGWGALSADLEVLAADVPSAPPNPTRGATSATQITLQLFPTHDNGGATVTNYELWRNDGEGGQVFTKITGYSYATHGFQHTVVLATESMTAGRYYQFVYRAINVVGTSPDSDVVAFPVADAPAKPASAPALVTSNKTSITVSWTKAVDTQSPAGVITGHHLYMDDGATGDF